MCSCSRLRAKKTTAHAPCTSAGVVEKPANGFDKSIPGAFDPYSWYYNQRHLKQPSTFLKLQTLRSHLNCAITSSTLHFTGSIRFFMQCPFVKNLSARCSLMSNFEVPFTWTSFVNHMKLFTIWRFFVTKLQKIRGYRDRCTQAWFKTLRLLIYPALHYPQEFTLISLSNHLHSTCLHLSDLLLFCSGSKPRQTVINRYKTCSNFL